MISKDNNCKKIFLSNFSFSLFARLINIIFLQNCYYFYDKNNKIVFFNQKIFNFGTKLLYQKHENTCNKRKSYR